MLKKTLQDRDKWRRLNSHIHETHQPHTKVGKDAEEEDVNVKKIEQLKWKGRKTEETKQNRKLLNRS